MPQSPVILAFESSCDDTGVALIRGNKVLANTVAKSSNPRKIWWSLFPSWRVVRTSKNIVPTLDVALEESGIEVSSIDAVAYTRGPGLMGSLHVGTSFAKSWAWSHGKHHDPCKSYAGSYFGPFLGTGTVSSFSFFYV